MRTGHYLFSIVHLFVVFLILLFGGFCFFLSKSSEARVYLSLVIEGFSEGFFTLGVSLVTTGSLLLVGLYLLNKKSYIKYKMDSNKTLIEESIVEEYIQTYFQELFPKFDTQLEVVIHGPKNLEVIANFPNMEEKDHDRLLHRVQNELGVLLARKLGYDKDFILTLQS